VAFDARVTRAAVHARRRSRAPFHLAERMTNGATDFG
jgi:hypothetical protein